MASQARAVRVHVLKTVGADRSKATTQAVFNFFTYLAIEKGIQETLLSSLW